MARVHEVQIDKVAAFLKTNPPKTVGMNFYDVPDGKGGRIVLDTMYPPIGHPQAIDFFFYVCLNQYGFWYGDDKGYVEPMIGNIGERKPKGSDLLWSVLLRQLNEDPDFFSAERLATVSPKALTRALQDDAGTQWPDFDQRLALTRQYGRWLLETGLRPVAVVSFVNAMPNPLDAFLSMLSDSTSGNPWAMDPLRKKQLLLAMVLANRPEQFLKVTDPMNWEPIVDYHLMRVALRLGLVTLSPLEKGINKAHGWVSAKQEKAIRESVWQAVGDLIEESGLSMAAIDETLWMARRYCPEMDAPNCKECLFTSVCAKRTSLFQPVYRTTAY